jgi:O-antigen ligase
MHQRVVRQKEKVSFKVVFLMLSIVFSFVNNFKYGGGISSIIVFIIGFGVSLLLGEIRFKLTRIHFLFYFFWFVICISTIISPLVDVKQDLFSFLVAVIFFMMVTSVSYNSKEIKLILLAYISTALIGSVNIIHNVMTDHQAAWHRYSTSFFGVDKDPNYASAFIVPAIMILLYTILFNGQKRNTWLYITALVIITIGTVSTGSRAAFLFVLVCYTFNFVVYLFKSNKSRIKSVVTFISIGGVLTLFWNLALDYFPESMVTRMTSLSSYTNDSVRTSIWEVGIKVFFEHPIIGVGLNGGNEYLLARGNHNSHNVYLDILTGTGIVGSIVFITILYNFSKVKSGNKLYILGIMAVMLGPLFFINGFNTPSFWIPMIILGILQKYSLQTKKAIYEWL